MKILCVLGKHNYGNPSRGESYEVSNFIPALHRLGHKVVFFESWNKDCYKDFADLNRQFLQTVQIEKPDIIFCVVLGYEIWLETLSLVRENCDAIIINWSTDDSWKYEQFSRFIAPVFHVYATTYASALVKSQKDGHGNFVLTQWAADAGSVVEPLPARECRYQVSFVGSAYGNRANWIKSLEKYGVTVACFGHGWPNGSVSAEDITKIIRESVISLNFGDSGLMLRGCVPRRSRQIKARVFEVPGAGGFLMTENAEDLEKFYLPGKEIVVYDGISDLAQKVEFFLSHPEERDKIARAGYVRTRDEHTYDARFEELLELASQRVRDCGERKTGTKKRQCEIGLAKVEALERSYRIGPFLRIIKLFLQLPCTIVWGRKRGPRAARRLLFEISWRIAGRKTYAASGLPGRLFYRES